MGCVARKLSVPKITKCRRARDLGRTSMGGQQYSQGGSRNEEMAGNGNVIILGWVKCGCSTSGFWGTNGYRT